MAFQVHISNSLQHLATAMFNGMQGSQQAVFKPHYIVTQTDGMNNWLKLQMASTLGIAANCQYIKPNDLINKLYQLLGGQFEQTLSPQHLHWLLYGILAQQNFVQKHNTIANYYNNSITDKDVKRIALAEKMADLFDQYQIYRSDIITEWNNNKAPKNTTQLWQANLWQNAKELAGTSFPDKTDIANYINEACNIEDNTNRLQQKLPTIYMFGISVISEYHVQILQKVAQYVDVHFLILNPSPAIYWYDDKSEKQIAFLKKINKIEQEATSQGNPLLTSWGKIIQNTFNLLFKNDDVLNNLNELETTTPLPNTLLHKIQLNITENEPIATGQTLTNANLQDGSLTINACYTPAREVEVLYNYLVSLVNNNSNQIAPQNILVMVSDVNQYASYIKAVFDAAPYKFKYNIADQNFADADSITNSLLNILQLTEANFTAEAVVQLLDASYIKKQFNITNLELIRHVVDSANIRFGITGNIADESMYISWQYGLKRIMYGICISNEVEVGQGAESFYPIDVVEGASAAQVIQFVHFVELLITAIHQRNAAKTLLQWVQYIDEVVHTFIYQKDDEVEEDYTNLMNQLAGYNNVATLFTEPISYDVFLHSFAKTLSSSESKNNFNVGGITFCSLIPMRSIPFKIVAMLGLHFDKFPRKENPLSFSIMQTDKRRGDRNVKENDKHLFLETILSAKEYLYISYIGMSIKDNSHIPASTLVDELLNYISSIAQNPLLVKQHLVTQHPLHNFSKQYNSGNKKLYSYTLSNNVQKINLLQPNKNNSISPIVITIRQFINGLKNPIKAYYNNVLGIYYSDEDMALQETEIFEIDKLQEWNLKNVLLHNSNPTNNIALKNELVKKGKLPLKNMATVALQVINKTIEPLKKTYNEVVANHEEQKVSIEILLGTQTLTGTIGNVYNNMLVGTSFSKSNETKNIFTTYIEYLLLRANGNNVSAIFISTAKNTAIEATPINKTDAINLLHKLLLIYTKAMQQLLVFDIGFGVDVKVIDALDDIMLNDILQSTFHNYNYPSKNEYLNREYENGLFNSSTAAQEYKQLATELLAPLTTIFPTYYA